MTPYYTDGQVAIFHGDCREVLPEVMLPLVELEYSQVMVTDPPYGTAHTSGWPSPWRNQQIQGDATTAVRDQIVALWEDRPALIFGSWKMPPPVGARQALVWDKGVAAGMGDLSIPWKPNWELIYVLGDGFHGRRDSGVISGYTMVTRIIMGRTHPNEKPVPLLRDLIGKCLGSDVIDPFMGTGSTLVAAKEAGRRAIGIEIEERYCEIAAQRCSQEVLGLPA